MSDYASPDRPEMRLSNADREDAVAQLADALAQGRLSATEYEERASAARAAIARSDLVPLFRDLPSTGLSSSSGRDASSGVQPDGYSVAQPNALGPGAPHSDPLVSEPDGSAIRQRALGSTVGATIMALTPFVALGLFLLTGHFGSYGWSWLWFLLIPIVGIIIYGPGTEYRSRR